MHSVGLSSIARAIIATGEPIYCNVWIDEHSLWFELTHTELQWPMANIQGDSVQSAAGEQKIKQLEQKQQQHCNPQRDVFFSLSPYCISILLPCWNVSVSLVFKQFKEEIKVHLSSFVTGKYLHHWVTGKFLGEKNNSLNEKNALVPTTRI